MSVNVNDLSITSLETIMAFGINGDTHRFTLDELQNATIANSQDNTALTGKGGRTIGQLKRNKSVTVSGTNGMVSMGLVEVEVGSVGEHRDSTPVRFLIIWLLIPIRPLQIIRLSVLLVTRFRKLS